jgi:16S rRNA (guanine(966)-N(2))-methyltransferase RsmD
MSGLRVISGVARGQKLRSVPGDSTRPITDRTKESLFNILGGDIQEATFLDLFAGTGSVGIEALSRGADHVLFIDNNRQAIQTIQTNLAHTGLEQGAEVRRMDAFQLIKDTTDLTYDYIYIAPPQYKNIWKKALLKLDSNPAWFSDDVWVIAQIDPVEYDSLNLHNLVEFDQRRYGSTLLVFYKRAIEIENRV